MICKIYYWSSAKESKEEVVRDAVYFRLMRVSEKHF